MRARHITKIRTQLKPFTVQLSEGLFGSFPNKGDTWYMALEIRAKTPLQAVERAQKRGFGEDDSVREGISKMFAHWKVTLNDGSLITRRNTFYF